MPRVVWLLRSKARVSVPSLCVPSVDPPAFAEYPLRTPEWLLTHLSTGEPAAVPCLLIGPGIFLLTPVTPAAVMQVRPHRVGWLVVSGVSWLRESETLQSLGDSQWHQNLGLVLAEGVPSWLTGLGPFNQ